VRFFANVAGPTGGALSCAARPFAHPTGRNTMYAVVKIKKQQFRVEPDTTLQVPLLADEVGALLNFDEVLMVSDGASVKVGNPVVAGAVVKAEVVAHGLSRKIVIFKKRRRKNYRRKTGHRQPFTQIRITGITG